MDSSRPFVSVIVPVFNAARHLHRLMDSLRSQSYPRDRFEVIMVDNGSTDGSAQVIGGFSEVVFASQIAYRTPGATRNAGIAKARGEVLALVDADCWTHPEWLSEGVRHLLENNLDRVAGCVQFVFSNRPNIYELFDSVVNFQQKEFVSEKWSGTGNLFIRWQVLDDIGLLDPVLRSGEDYEFGVRATQSGKTLGFCPAAIVYHRTRKSLLSLFTKFVRAGYGAGQLFRKYGYFGTSAFYRKANYRPVCRTWKSFPVEYDSARVRLQIDLLWNAMRVASNLGNLAGYFDLARVEDRRT